MRKNIKNICIVFFAVAIILLIGKVELTNITVSANSSKYMLGNTSNLSDNQIVDPGGENTSAWQTDSVSVSKTIDGTDTEDYFDITLQVKTKKPVTEYLQNEAVAIVIVMDLSNTMNSAIDGSSTSTYENSKAYKAVAAAQSFAQQFYNGTKNYPNNVIGAVGFNTNGINLVGMSNLNTQAKVNTFNSTLYSGVYNVVKARGYDDSHDRFTNIEAGLKMARTMLSNCQQKHKFIIFLSDGLPTTYTTGTGATNYTGIRTNTLNDGLNNRTLDAGNYSDTGAKRARQVAMDIKSKGITIYSIGVGLSTFKGYDNSNVPYGSNPNKLNGEKFIMNEIGRQIVTTVSTVENGFGRITYLTGNNWRVRTWNHKKDEILGLDWEIKNNFNPATMGTTPKYVLSENPPSGQPALFENWLKYGIGSGYYYDVNNNNALSAALDDIYSQLNTNVLSKRTTLWRTNDPMSSYEAGALKEYIEFIGFFNQNGNLVNQLTGTHGQNNTNTASLDRTTMPDGVINWDLKNSGYTVLSGDIYLYQLKYRVRLKTDKQGFVKEVPYDSNGKTTLTYVIEENNTVSDPKTIDYPIPQVKGFLVDIKVKKIVEGVASGFAFTTENSTFTFKVTLKRLDGSSVKNTNRFSYDKYDARGAIIEQGTITDGETFTLLDGQYIIIKGLYHNINWTVSETLKNGFVASSIGTPNGTTKSNVPLSEVEYHNKAYQLKMLKIDKNSKLPLENVKFSLYATYEKGVFSNLVTNMNGVLLQNLLTDESGYIDFGNLSFILNGETTYYLVEEDTIDKYNLLDNYVEIKVSASGITAKYNDVDLQLTNTGYVYQVEVPNAKGIDLPETGGSGNARYIIIGLFLMLFSGVTYYIKNMKKKERNEIDEKMFRNINYVLSKLFYDWSC